jgi:hypothetical protein
MARITVYCNEAKGLKLGPGLGIVSVPGDLIVFEDGYATFEEKDYPHWQEWRFAVGTPFLEVLDEGEVAATPEAEFVCPNCGKAFATKNKLNGHRMSHRGDK